MDDVTRGGHRILAIDPGSTSGKIALFEGERCLLKSNIVYDREALAGRPDLDDKIAYHRALIKDALAEEGYGFEGIEAYSARSGGMASIEWGAYAINGTMLHDLFSGEYVPHPCCLGAKIALELAHEHGGLAMVVSDPTTDEFPEVARITGLKGVYRNCYAHTLNHKEVGRRFAEQRGKRYEDLNLVICHLGGGVSVAAHNHGRLVDTNDIAYGEGPMSPGRCGSIAVNDIIRLCFTGKTEAEVKRACLKEGGFLSHLGTDDLREVEMMVAKGDGYAQLVLDAFCYQVGKAVGSAAAVLHGEVDGLIVTGGMAHDDYVVRRIREMCGWIAPEFQAFPGEFELEGLVTMAEEVLEGGRSLKTYTGVPVWKGYGHANDGGASGIRGQDGAARGDGRRRVA